ncbi:uncharacterized protein [Elaeis guineensis]|uniref:Uncharacterized protein LOC105060827 isoform X1 n=2 Tax=Elaeis guineensis var. tenera TaxID=51953 RepID=A0A6J0P9Q4_ELAGV|nr:uncharacterized protein LOC105060827 isoform X1 [Elaeis guineensis]
MEMELEPRVKPLAFKVKAMSRESPAQKAAHVLDPDLRTHWSTATNTKEWILLELDEACLLSHIRIYNKSVLEWEITAGLRYKPETFVKVRPRCEAPRRDMVYPVNYTPCRYVRISCLRGNPIALFFIQLLGVTVAGLEPEFQPVINYLLPQIISHKQDAHDMHLQLLQDMASRLLVFLPQLEAELTSFADAAETNIRFLAMLAGPLYPILHLVNEREAAKTLLNSSDSDAFRTNQTSTLTVSSNFEPRRSRSPSPFVQPASSFIAFRPDAVIILLRKAYKDSHLGTVCRIASRTLQKLIDPITTGEESMPPGDLTLSSTSDEITKTEVTCHMHLADYSSLFGEEFRIPEDNCDAAYLNVLDIAAVEEGILHVLYACASQPLFCCKLADSNSNFWSILPLVQALLPALRPPVNCTPPVHVDDSFWLWKHASVQNALSQIVTMSSSSVYRPLLRACAGYLASFLSSHAKAACVLIDLCSGPLSPWISTITAKADLAIELLEDLLGVIQGARQSIARARAALKYIILALSGHMDDVLAKYKEVKHKLLFLLEMLEPFLDPAITSMENTIAFGDVSSIVLEKQKRSCAIALNIIRTAVQRPAVLPSLESEWRRGSVAPSVLLSVLGPHMPLPPEIDLCKCSVSKVLEQENLTVLSGSSIHSHVVPSLSCGPEETDLKIDASEGTLKVDVFEDANLLFAPTELKKTMLTSLPNHFIKNSPDKVSLESNHGTSEGKHVDENISTSHFQLENGFSADCFNLQADYLQLVSNQDCEFRAAEFQRLALDLSSQPDITPEGHDAAIDALLLAAECYVNPFFMLSFRPTSKLIDQMKIIGSKLNQNNNFMELKSDFQNVNIDMETIAHLERKRDRTVLQILLQAAKLDREYQKSTSDGESCLCEPDDIEHGIEISPLDTESADAVTLVRQNQALLCDFVMRQLRREQHSSHEILLQSLLFLLYSATKLFCSPENVIDIILQSAENLNQQLMSLYHEFKFGNIQLDPEKLHGIKRRWGLLQRLVMASSGNDGGTDLISNMNGFQYRSLVPPSSWMQKISKFSNYACPLPRFLGWMAVSRYAKQFLKERLFLASDLSQLTSLLSIFADELALMDNVGNQKVEPTVPEPSDNQQTLQVGLSDHLDGQHSLRVLYPVLHLFFPNMKKQFRSFGEIILEAIGLQLKCLPCSAVPDILCWFSDLCLWPYVETLKDQLSFPSTADCLKGYTAANAKAVVIYVLESIVGEHMEAMVPEMPRVAHILMSLCRASYCDVAFLDSVLRILKPLISYFLRKATHDEELTDLSSWQDFELLNFEELFNSIRYGKESKDDSGEKNFQGSLMIFILGSLFPDLSFKRKMEILQSLLLWADFTNSEPTCSLYNYLLAFQKVMDSCDIVLSQNLRSFGIHNPVDIKQSSETASTLRIDGSLNQHPSLQDNAEQVTKIRPMEEFESSKPGASLFHQGFHHLSADEIEGLLDGLEKLIFKLIRAIEVSWKLHYQLTLKLTYTSAKCILLSRCLCSISQTGSDGGGSDIPPSDSSDLSPKYWRNALEGLTGAILTSQQNHCWQVASGMLDYLFKLPKNISVDCVISSICSAIKHFCCHAPKISWRLQSDKWLSSLFMRGIGNLNGDEASLVDLFCTMLAHSEPEQRSVALRLLGRIVDLSGCDGIAKLSYTVNLNVVGSGSAIYVPESIISILVSKTWNSVAAVALSDPSMQLRTNSMALLSGYMPFAERTQLQSIFMSTNTILRGMGKLSHSMEEGHLTRLSLGLLATACLYSSSEDIALIPEGVWRNLESMGMSKTGVLDNMEKKLCLALCKLRTESDSAKAVLKEVLSSSSAAKPNDPNFESTRESILQVLSSLTSLQSYFDFFSEKIERESRELEEAEIEMDLLQKEKALQERSGCPPDEAPLSQNISYYKMDDKRDNDRLQKIKDGIGALERSKLREEMIVRRQKKLLMRRARQKYLEEAASREMELLQELDKERTSELEHEIERQRQLEVERVKTRELQFNLDMEREKQTQRELQRELEQVESGVRSSRREFSSNPNSRPRERYRERENGRSGQHEGSLRSSSRDRESGAPHMVTSGSSGASPAPTVVLAGSRSFSGQLPTILQSRERTDERTTTSYEENIEGSRDSGDTSSVGDPDLGSAFDGLAGGFGSAPRHGSRGSKSRQIIERRERDGRREGKWERKH